MQLQLDHPRIPIRERSLLDILDLSLKVSTVLSGPLLLASVVTVLPLALLNWWLVGWTVLEVDEGLAVSSYLWLLAQLVFIEAPLASVPATMFLGKAMFFQTLTIREMIADLRELLPRLLWCQLVLRGTAAAWFVVALTRRQEDLPLAFGLMFLLVCCVIVVRARRPFINEIILLERAPWRARDRSTITVRRRSAALHDPSTADLLGRWIVSFGVAILTTIALAFTLWFVWWVVVFDLPWGPMMYHVAVPAAMWLVAGYFSVVRFLSYLDLRIRREGWEVELIVHAAAKRLEKPVIN